MNRKLKDIPPEVRQFAMRITSTPEYHKNIKCCNAWIDKERKKFANEIMDLFEKFKK